MFGTVVIGPFAQAKVKSLLYPASTNLRTSATQWGQLHELTASNVYRRRFLGEGHTLRFSGNHIASCGFLAASPQGVIVDTLGKLVGMLEIKCSYSARNNSCQAPGFYLVDGHPKLKSTHIYYYQVQGAMAISGAPWCDFVIWTFLISV